jgi:Glycosyl transferase family 2
MGDDPLVTVLIPARNAAAFLPASLESIFAQTYRDLEVVVVDDASADQTPDLLAGASDPRLRILRLERQRGVAAALNAGLEVARGRLVARMDADDIALPDRLERELGLLQRDRSVGIVGGNLQPIDERGRLSGAPTDVPTSPGHVRWMLHVHNCVNHPTVVARREVLEDLGGYRGDAEPAEDYDLWVRAIEVTRIANVPEVVVRYRLHGGSSSTANLVDATRSADAVASSALTRLLGHAPNPDALRALRASEPRERTSAQQLRGASALLWRFTGAVLADPSLTRDDLASIRRDAVGWFGALLRRAARHDPLLAASLVLPYRDGPPAWALARGAAAAGRSAVRSLARS